MKYKLKKISGDASFREFYRLEKKNKTSIIVSAKKEKFKNLIVYAVVNKILNCNKINAPKLLSNHYSNDMIEISDLGEKSFYDYVISKKSKLNDYRSLVKIIIKVQKIKVKKYYKLGKFKVKFSKYSLNNLHKESDLFFDWYLKYFLKKKKISKIKKLLKAELNKIYKKLKFSNNTFVHRDFHVSNIMIYKKKLFIIDSQDALFGNIAYDLASLIDDVRIKTSKKIKKTIYEKYFLINKKKINKKNFNNDFLILSILRNFKIIGIFKRLHKRDKKKTYLKLIPYAWKLIEERVEERKDFKYLKINIDKYFPKEVRYKL